MKLEDLTRPSLLTAGALGVVGLAAVAAAGFALGMAVGRDPEGAKRRALAVVDSAARAFEQASLLAAQARERAGDLWAEARAQAVSHVDEQDFARASAAAAMSARAAAERPSGDADAPPAPAPRAPRRSAKPRAAAKRRAKSAADDADKPAPGRRQISAGVSDGEASSPEAAGAPVAKESARG